MSILGSYGKVYAVGKHRETAGIFDAPVWVEEKVDGSQINFGLVNGELVIETRNTQLTGPDENKTFAAAWHSLHERAYLMREGVVYRGEYLSAPRHNKLRYDRAPRGHVVLWQAEEGGEVLHTPSVATELDLEAAPVLHEGKVESLDFLRGLMARESFLGRAKIEGVVCKRVDQGELLKAKLVSDAFREVKRQPKPKGKLEDIIDAYRSERRWEKAIERLRDRGELDESPKDIGPLLREVQQDVEEECHDDVREALWKAYRKDFLRGVAEGLPQWYQRRLVSGAFDE